MSETVGITVVFTDLVGSTEMSNRLGPEETEALRVVHIDLLRQGMDAHGGTEVKNLGDGLMIVFPSLGSALDGSVAMQQAIERHNSSGKEPLGIRVGISSGDATEEDNDYFGEPVVEAARLCAKCEAGQIIVSDLLKMMARRSDHTFTDIGELELRGLPDPVPSFTVDWEPMAVEAAMELPGKLHRDLELNIAGRVQHLETLQQALKDTQSGTLRLSLLAGEPGIGKTRLSCETAIKAHEDGAIALYGRCDEELGLPYQPWVEAISYFIENGPEELVSRVVQLHGPELSLLVPQIRRRFPEVGVPASTDAETERYLLLQAVTACLKMISTDQPVILVLDDLHWADKQTLTLLRHVYTNIEATSLMMIGTYRDSDLDAGHPLIDTVAALRREVGVEQISVEGLGDTEMVELITISALGHEIAEEIKYMAVHLRQETAGNPFFAHEILRNLVESGDLYIDDEGVWRVDKTFDELALPQSVSDVVGQRIARLGEESLKALRAAAVIGKEFDLELLAEVTGNDEDDLLDLLEAAIAAGILAEVSGGEERFRFLHSLARNTLQEELSDGRKRRMHRKIAEALEESLGSNPGARVSELATHWMAAAAPIEGAKAIQYARMAGRHAQESLAPDEAIRWFTGALEHHELIDDADEQIRAEILVELGTAQQHAGDPEYRQTLLDAGALAKQIGSTKLMVDAALANNRGMYSKLGAVDEERILTLDAALDAVGGDPSAERALLLGTLFSEKEYAASFEERTEMMREALSIARGLDDAWVLSSVLNRSCITSAVPSNLADRLAASAESLEIADGLGDPSLKFWATCGAFQAALGSADRPSADAHLASLSALADEIGRPSFQWVAGNHRGNLLSATGNYVDYEAQAGLTLTIGTEAGEPDAFDYYVVAVLASRWLEGRTMEVIDQLVAASADKASIEAYTAVASMFCAQDGDKDRARELLELARIRKFVSLRNNPWSTSMQAWSATASILEDRESAELLYELLLPCAGQFAGQQAYTMGSIDTTLGELATVRGNHDEAEAHFATAEEQVASFGSPFFVAANNLGRARLHAKAGNAIEAVKYASRCSELSAEHGYQSCERRATELLESLTS